MEPLRLHAKSTRSQPGKSTHPPQKNPPPQRSEPIRYPSTNVTVSSRVDDVDAHLRHASSCGAGITYEPRDMPYDVREYGVRDLEKRFWSFMTPLD